MTFKQSLFFILLIFCLPFSLIAQDTIRPDSVIKNQKLVTDDRVVIMLDSLANLKIFEDAGFPNAHQYQNWSTYTDSDVPSFSDSVYRERIAQLNDQSPFEFVYNGEVRKFIELYAVRKRKLTARILGLSQIYFPLFEEQLDKYNMPLELKYLAVIESALNPTANSPAGAKGLWQFMYGTGKVYGLKVSSYVDDRFDPFKATIAACEHLTDLYNIYGSWSLALAAYNSGAGNVNKAIRRSGGIKNFWAIQKYLPRETASYVPAFIAASYVITYANEHKIYPVDPGILYYEVDTVTVRNPLSFSQISEMLNIPMDEIEFLNPSFKHLFIPASAENPYKLRLRKKHIGDFINNETALYAYRTQSGLQKDSMMKLIYENYREADLYTVKSGESMTSIAKKFHMSVSELKSLNNTKKNSFKPKKKILVYTKPASQRGRDSGVTSTYVPQVVPKDTSVKQKTDQAATPEPVAEKSSAKSTPTDETPKTIHVVTSGESLGSIANKYHCTTSDLMKWNNLTSQKITVGQKIRLVSNGQASTTTVKAESPSKTKKPPSTGQKFTWYTIQSGDNLWDVADKFDVTVSQIKTINNFKNSNRLQLGQKIKIPK